MLCKKEEFAYLEDVITKIKSGAFRFFLYNYTALYEMGEYSEQPEAASNERLIETDVICVNNTLSMNLPCKKGQQRLLSDYLDQFMRQTQFQ